MKYRYQVSYESQSLKPGTDCTVVLQIDSVRPRVGNKRSSQVQLLDNRIYSQFDSRYESFAISGTDYS